LLVRTVRGHKMLLDSRDIGITPHLALDGWWEPSITAVFQQIIKPGMTVIEVGANVGYYTLLACDAIGSNGRLFAFEANPTVADLLVQNIELNGFLGRCQVIKKAVYSTSTNLEFRCCEEHNGSSGLWLSEDPMGGLYAGTTKKITVSAIALDDFFPPGTCVDLIKIDAEGAEPHILRGAKRLLSENPEVKIILECFPSALAAGAGGFTDFMNLLDDLDLNFQRIEENGATVWLDRQALSGYHHSDLLLLKAA
jgi:FkbM family methyltransferase